jgi:hypothetical protein
MKKLWKKLADICYDLEVDTLKFILEEKLDDILF